MGEIIMFCKNCGEQLNENQVVCLKCGVERGKGKGFCENCGTALPENAEVCLSCGTKNVRKKNFEGVNIRLKYRQNLNHTNGQK